jgi:hypothetical protein
MSAFWLLLAPVAAFGCSWLLLKLTGWAFGAIAHRKHQRTAPINFPRQQDRRAT